MQLNRNVEHTTFWPTYRVNLKRPLRVPKPLQHLGASGGMAATNDQYKLGTYTRAWNTTAYSPQNKYGRRLSKKGKSHISRQGDKDYIHRKRQEYEVVEDKDPIAQIDVASFIQKPDEYAVDENFPYKLDSNQRKTKLKHDNDYGSLLEYSPDEYIMKRSNKRPYHLNPDPDNSFDLGPNSLLSKDTINSRHFDSPSSRGLNNVKVAQNFEHKQSFGNYRAGLYNSNTHLVHSPEKKSVLKYMKFPFFFHNKTETLKPKKEKKRKVFCFNCSKNDNKRNNISSSDHKAPAMNDNQETLNSVSMNALGNSIANPQTKTSRGKRDYWSNANDRQRQLQELEEIQRRVDNLEIPATYQKASRTA